MKELDSFTVERLGEIKNAFLDCNKETAPSIGEIFALIDIALAAKRAEPCGYAHKNAIKFDLHDTCRLHEQAGDENFIALYTTPQLNSPEIPDGWTSSDPANAALVMLDRIDTIDSADDDRIEDIKLIIRQLASAPEKPL
ncbi:hypothetical protein [Yersinia enterocolitica]|uniref:hypothetical protein n=1 Tax=Yersinia enterocolitica TaxID=630 RepID=UPI00313BF05F